MYSKPFPICVYEGVRKPKSIDLYLEKFTDVLSEIFSTGVQIQNEHFSVIIKCFICDLPARSFIKCIKGHTGYSNCERCDVRGVYYKKKIIFTDLNRSLRTDETFHCKQDKDHHLGTSPLEEIT